MKVFRMLSLRVLFGAALSAASFSAEAASISGRVASNGTGVPDAKVRVGQFVTFTDAQGNFTVTNLEPGWYHVSAGKGSMRVHPLGLATVQVAAADVTGVDFDAQCFLRNYTFVDGKCIRERFTVSGRVSLDGVGIPGIVVSTVYGRATTDGSGAFQLNNIPRGRHKLFVRSYTYIFNATFGQSIVDVQGNISGLEFTARCRKLGYVAQNGQCIAKAETPTTIRATDGRYNAVVISWMRMRYASSYRIYRADAQGGAGVLLGEVRANRFRDATGTPNQRYYYSVSAVSPFGESTQTTQDEGFFILRNPAPVMRAVLADRNFITTSFVHPAIQGARLSNTLEITNLADAAAEFEWVVYASGKEITRQIVSVEARSSYTVRLADAGLNESVLVEVRALSNSAYFASVIREGEGFLDTVEAPKLNGLYPFGVR